MGETIEQRLRRLAKEDNATMHYIYPGDVVEILDTQLARIAELQAALDAARGALEDTLRLIDEHGGPIIKAHATRLTKARRALAGQHPQSEGG